MERILPAPMKITWEDDKGINKHLLILTDAEKVFDQDSLTSSGFSTNSQDPHMGPQKNRRHHEWTRHTYIYRGEGVWDSG